MAAADGVPYPYVFLLLGVAALVFALARRRRREPPDLRPPGSFDVPSRDPRQELERLLLEIQDLSREHIAKLDTKIRLLNQLLLDCDRKKAELEALLGKSTSSPAPRPANPLHDQVYTLRDAGQDVAAICQATGLEKGEVELILGLRRPDSRI
ncbi:MAG TPA: hypothetical protein VF950_21895 [Planctomycetota bacterium]